MDPCKNTSKSKIWLDPKQRSENAKCWASRSFLERSYSLAVVPVPWWEAKLLARAREWLPKPRCQRSWRRNSKMANLFPLFSSRCFPVGRCDLLGNLTILVVERNRNNERASKSCYSAKCTLWECFFPWPYPGLALIIYRDIWLTPNDMVYVWVSWGWLLEGTAQGPYHISLVGFPLSWFLILVEKWRTFQLSLPSFPSVKT